MGAAGIVASIHCRGTIIPVPVLLGVLCDLLPSTSALCVGLRCRITGACAAKVPERSPAPATEQRPEAYASERTGCLHQPGTHTGLQCGNGASHRAARAAPRATAQRNSQLVGMPPLAVWGVHRHRPCHRPRHREQLRRRALRRSTLPTIGADTTHSSPLRAVTWPCSRARLPEIARPATDVRL